MAAIVASTLSLVPAAHSEDLMNVSDRLAIGEIVAQYAHQWDAKNAEGFAARLEKAHRRFLRYEKKRQLRKGEDN